MYSWLKVLGIEKTNSGVFSGEKEQEWSGIGKDFSH